MVAQKTETKNYGDAMRLYFATKEEYEDWIARLEHIADMKDTSEDMKNDIHFLIEKIQKRKNEEPFENKKSLGDVDTLLFVSELSTLTTIFMQLIPYIDEIAKKYEDSESLITSILDGNK